MKHIHGQQKPCNRDLESASLFAFNVYKIMTKKDYPLNNWGDLQSHLSKVGAEAGQKELEFVETNGKKLSPTDFSELKDKYAFKCGKNMEEVYKMLV